MPRDIPVSNGNLLINFDSKYQLRDFHFPQVGGENHSAGHPFRFGVWAEGEFSWVHGDDWQRKLDYQTDSLVTSVTLSCEWQQIELHCNDTIDFHENVYLKQIKVKNCSNSARRVRLFFGQDFHISDYELGDTAAYYPQMNAVIHYKGDRYFLVNGLKEDGSGISDYATGYKEMPGAEGTWRDCEDGALGKGPISQGSVDSAIGIHLHMNAGDESTVYYWICCGTNYHEVSLLDRLVRTKGPQKMIERTDSYWRLWTNKENYDYSELSEGVVNLFKRSLLVLRTQIDNGGAIIAANDTDITQFNRDTYSYMWPRDGALVAHALDLAGHPSLSLDFFRFCRPLITKEGYFLHKYNPDGSVGSSWHPWMANGKEQLPIQEDETALVLWSLWKHFDRHRDVERIKPFYRDVVIRAGTFLAEYLDPVTGLPGESYDLWEERRGIHAWSVGAVYGGLLACANFAALFGELAESEQFVTAANAIKQACDTHLFRPEYNRFARMLSIDDNGVVQPDMNIDASIVGLTFFGMYEANDPRISSSMEQILDRLWIKTEVGGLARYENDYYHQVSHDVENVAGNPWFICSLWIAQYYIEKATTEEELRKALPILEWVVQHALPSGVLAEQVDPYSHAPLSVSPLTWSHAGYITTVIEYLDKKSLLAICPTCGQPTYTREGQKQLQDRAHWQIAMPE